MNTQLLPRPVVTEQVTDPQVRARLLAACDTQVLAPVTDVTGSGPATHVYLPFRLSPLAAR